MSETKIDTISKETHDALLEKALKDATSALEGSLERKTQELSAAQQELASKGELLKTALAETERLNGELDAAQIQLKSTTEEVASLKADIATREEAAKRAEVASVRAAQVENLGLFGKEYVTEKASRWADMAEQEWTERLEEWRQLKPAATPESAGKADTASAMTGTTGQLTSVPADTASQGSARRAALGLN